MPLGLADSLKRPAFLYRLIVVASALYGQGSAMDYKRRVTRTKGKKRKCSTGSVLVCHRTQSYDPNPVLETHDANLNERNHAISR